MGWVSDSYYARVGNFPPVLYWRGSLSACSPEMVAKPARASRVEGAGSRPLNPPNPDAGTQKAAVHPRGFRF